MKHLPFASVYRPDFAVVEQRMGGESHYPHDTQLPIIWRALDLEFRDGLPGRIARVDQRADGFHKIVRRMAGLMFCAGVNAARPDGVRLMSFPDENLVGRLVVVQQITRETPRGRTHRFRFYGGGNFQPEIRLSGKRLVFSDHVIERFSTRVPNNVGEDLTNLLLALYGSPILSMALGVGRALVVPYDQSILAFTYKETAEEFFLTTCLTIKEMSTLKISLPPLVYNWHYGESFRQPKIRNWIPVAWMKTLFQAWERKIPLDGPHPRPLRKDWPRVGHVIKDVIVKAGHGPASKICFQDDIPGPCVLESKPGQSPMQYDELAMFKQAQPEENWDELFAQRDRYLLVMEEERELQP